MEQKSLLRLNFFFFVFLYFSFGEKKQLKKKRENVPIVDVFRKKKTWHTVIFVLETQTKSFKVSARPKLKKKNKKV